MNQHATTSEEFFEKLYQQNPDPWNFADSTYELHRYERTVNALGGQRYRRAFEPGCSIGVLTASLAELCTEVIAIDISQSAVTQARKRCASLPNVHIDRGALPEAMPGGFFDLIVFSEIGYYFEEQPLEQLVSNLLARLQKRGTFLAVHWLGHSPDHVLSGDRVHEILMAQNELKLTYSERHELFRLDRWSRGK